MVTSLKNAYFSLKKKNLNIFCLTENIIKMPTFYNIYILKQESTYYFSKVILFSSASAI